MTPERDLGVLLGSIDPQLHPDVFVFCALTHGTVPAGLDVTMMFREREATTVVVPLAEARARHLSAAFPCQWITLGAPSDLDAVGFLAAVTTALAAAGISTNAVSAFHHDHLFVPEGRGDEAMDVLRGLQRAH